MTPNPISQAVGSGHHDRRVPAHVVADASLDASSPGKGGSGSDSDRIAVVGYETRSQSMPLTSHASRLARELARSLRSLSSDQCIDGVDPFLRLFGVWIEHVMGVHPRFVEPTGPATETETTTTGKTPATTPGAGHLDRAWSYSAEIGDGD